MLPEIEVSYLCSEKPGCETRMFQKMAVYSYGNWVMLSFTYQGSGNDILCNAGWAFMDVAQGLAHTKLLVVSVDS